MKAFFKKYDVLIDLMLFALVVFGFAWLIATPVTAAEFTKIAVNNDSASLFELLSVLVGGEAAAQWLGMLGLACYLFTHLIAWLPATWVAKLPNWLIKLINLGAANYRGTKNEVDSTVSRVLKIN